MNNVSIALRPLIQLIRKEDTKISVLIYKLKIDCIVIFAGKDF